MIDQEIVYTEEIKKLLKLVKKINKNIFITGRAGTGKTTLLQIINETIDKNKILLAPTGVAAVNIKGQTIHSFFRFKPNITTREAKKLAQRHGKNKIYQKLELLIIDEISMVRADLLDAVNIFLQTSRKNNLPFGGVRVIFFGDLFQLPPVVKKEEETIFTLKYGTPYFFSSDVMQSLSQDNFAVFELKTVFRQKNQQFIEILNKIRNNNISQEDLRLLNQRVQKYAISYEQSKQYIYLTTTNYRANYINQANLKRINYESKTYKADLEGNFKENQSPNDSDLVLKPNAKVIFLNNDPAKRWINGTLGRIVELHSDEIIVRLEDSARTVSVEPFTWHMYQPSYHVTKNKIDYEVVGSYTQMPLKLAWAVTIHKSQGKTFNHIIVDLGRGTFAHGQLYVALSRCTKLQGVILKQPVKKSHILFDDRITKFIEKYSV